MLAIQRRLSRVAREERGTTFVEVGITALIMTVITTAVLSVWARSQSEAGDIGKRRDFLNDSRYVINQLTKEIRQATRIYENKGGKLDVETLIGGSPYRVVYTVTGNTLTRRLGTSPSTVLITNLTSPDVFTYTTIDTFLQQVTITLQVKTEIPNGVSANFVSTVQLRNIT